MARRQPKSAAEVEPGVSPGVFAVAEVESTDEDDVRLYQTFRRMGGSKIESLEELSRELEVEPGDPEVEEVLAADDSGDQESHSSDGSGNGTGRS